MLWVIGNPKLTIIGVLVLFSAVTGYVAYNMVTISRLEARVAHLEQSIASKDNQIRSLVSSVDTQNAEVQRWQSEAASRAQAAHQAMRQAQEARRRSDEAIGRLRSMEAMTCEEGIELIDEVLGL